MRFVIILITLLSFKILSFAQTQNDFKNLNFGMSDSVEVKLDSMQISITICNNSLDTFIFMHDFARTFFSFKNESISFEGVTGKQIFPSINWSKSTNKARLNFENAFCSPLIDNYKHSLLCPNDRITFIIDLAKSGYKGFKKGEVYPFTLYLYQAKGIRSFCSHIWTGTSNELKSCLIVKD